MVKLVHFRFCIFYYNGQQCGDWGGEGSIRGVNVNGKNTIKIWNNVFVKNLGSGSESTSSNSDSITY